MQVVNEGWAIPLTQNIVNENLPRILAQGLFLLLEFVHLQFESTQNYLLQSLTLCMLCSMPFISSLIHSVFLSSALVCPCMYFQSAFNPTITTNTHLQRFIKIRNPLKINFCSSVIFSSHHSLDNLIHTIKK